MSLPHPNISDKDGGIPQSGKSDKRKGYIAKKTRR
jgi:hypothetical protein